MTESEKAAVRASNAWRGMRALVLDLHDRRKIVCDELDMSWVKAKALWVLTRGPLTLRQLGPKIGADAPYTTLVVDELRRRGLVTREPNPADGRSKLVALTTEGMAAADVYVRVMDEPPAVFGELADTDLAELERIVAQLISAS